MRRSLLALAAGLLSAPLGAQIPTVPPESRCALPQADRCSIYGVSMVELIANPAMWDGKKVSLEGFLYLAFESNALYLHEDDYKHALTNNSLTVDFATPVKPEDITCKSGSYVHVVGTFGALGGGLRGLHSGTIVIERCSPWY